jgi:flagellin
MAFDISLTSGMRSDLINLQGAAKLLTRTQGRLSSGKAINSAVDDPAKYFAAQDHMSHASDLSTRKSDMGEAIQAVKAANQGITSITALINQAQALVQSAGSATITTRATLAAQFNTIRTQIDQLAADSGYNGKNFLKSDTLSVLFNETGTSSMTVTGFLATSSGLGITSAATGSTNYTGASVGGSTGGVMTAATYTLANLGTVYTGGVVITQNFHITGEALGISGGAITAGTVLTLSGYSSVTPSDVVLYATGTALTAGEYTVALSGTSIVVTMTSAASLVTGATMTVGYSGTYNLTAGQYTLAAGTDATAGTLTFAANITGAVTVTYSVDVGLWSNSTATTTDTNNLNAAITTMRSQASTMAANLGVVTTRQDWSQGMIDNLTTGSDNLTLADMNEEGANMLALQTRQQLGIQALSLASQANQSIMRLFP